MLLYIIAEIGVGFPIPHPDSNHGNPVSLPTQPPPPPNPCTASIKKKSIISNLTVYRKDIGEVHLVSQCGTLTPKTKKKKKESTELHLPPLNKHPFFPSIKLLDFCSYNIPNY